MSERPVFSPRTHDEIGGFPEFFSPVSRWYIVVENLRTAPGSKPRDKTPMAHLIEHGVFLGNAHGIQMQGQEIPQNNDFAARGALRQRRGNEVGRRHQTVDVLVMFI